MKKLLTQFYLLMSILLMTGAHANAFASDDTATLNNASGQDELKSDFSTTNVAKFISYSRFHFEKQTETVLSLETENEEESHEFALSKLLIEKKATTRDYSYLSTYFTPATKVTTDTFTKICVSGNYFHSLSSRQYILYEVFRI